MQVEGLLEWRAACSQCGDEFEVDSLPNPYPDGLNCPTCRKRQISPPGRLTFTTDQALPSVRSAESASVQTADEDLEAPIDDPT